MFKNIKSEKDVRKYLKRIKKGTKRFWNWISAHVELSESFIVEYQENFDLSFLVRFQSLSENIIRKFKDKLNWNNVILYQILSEPFMEEFETNIDWSIITWNQEVSGEFVEKHIDKIGFKNICYRNVKDFPERFLLKHKKEIDWDHVLLQQKLSENIINQISDIVSLIEIRGFQEMHEKIEELLS